MGPAGDFAQRLCASYVINMKKIILCGWLLLFVSGCGYQLAGELNLPSYIKTIAVPIFKNQTTEPFIEKLLTEAVIRRIQHTTDLKVVDTDRADAILYGLVVNYDAKAPLVFDRFYGVGEYRLRLTAQFELLDKDKNIIWAKQRISGKAEYYVKGSVLSTQDAEIQAQLRASDEVSRDLITMWE